MTTVYFIYAPEVAKMKIGFTSGLVEDRLAQLQTGSPVPLLVYRIIPHGTLGLERRLHQVFASSRAEGEWFWFKIDSPLREWFSKIEELDQEVRSAERRLLDHLWAGYTPSVEGEF